jgi:TldD protein
MDQLIPLLAEVVRTLETQAPYASAYARRDAGTQIRVDSASTTCQPVPPNAGLTLSAWTGARFIEESSDRLDAEGVLAASAALQARIAAVGVVRDGLVLEPGETLHRTFAQSMERDSLSVPAAEKIALAHALRATLAGPQLQEATAIVGDVHSEIVFVNRTRRLHQHLHRVRQIVLGIWAADGAQVQLHGGFERIGGWEHQTLTGAALANRSYLAELRRDGPRLIGAPRLPDPGEHTCVFDGAFAGIFAHEAFGHGTEQDLYLKDRSEGAHWLGKAVASPLVQMFDDPANGWAASYFFDDEGTLSQPTEIIRNGVLQAGLNDRYSHAVLSRRGLAVRKTANGRREAYDHKPYTRMTNTFFGAGESSLDELIAGVEHGYYLTHPSNGMEDPKGWGIQLEGAMAEEIRDGKLTGRVFSPIVVTGSVPRLLQSVDGVGRELVEASVGMCGKGYKEWVKVTDGGPALRLKAVIA